MLSRRAPWLAACLFAGTAIAQPLSGSAASEARAEALRKTSAELVCQCGCNMILSECSHQSCPYALPERERILALVDTGKTPEQIIATYVAESGRAILSAPPTDASLLDRAAWWVPIVALAGGLIVASGFAFRFTRLARAQKSPSPAVVSEAADAYRARVASELEATSGDRP